MKQIVLIISLLFILAIIYLITMPPKDITLEEMLKYIPPTVAPDTNTEEPYIRETTPVDSFKKDGDDTLQADYYIVVESFRNLTLAQQKAEKLKNDFNTNFIVLPPTTEGYYRISCGKYSTPEEAKSAIERARANISSSVWIFTVKK